MDMDIGGLLMAAICVDVKMFLYNVYIPPLYKRPLHAHALHSAVMLRH
jgi:riboflavin transporter FmnP